MSDRRGRAGRAGAMLAVAVVAIASGCAASLSSFQPAHVGPRGVVRVELGEDVSIPTGALATAIDVGKTLAQGARTRTLTDDQKIELISAGMHATLNPPAFNEHLGASYNFADGWELSLRYAAGGFRLGSRYQIFEQARDGVDVSVGFGVARYSYQFPLQEIIDVLRVEEFERWNVDVPLVAGWHGSFYRVWMGPRVAFSRHATELSLRTPGEAGGPEKQEVARASGTGTFFGVQAGGALGYRFVFVAAELTVVRFRGNAQLDVFGRTASADTDSWIIQPGVGLMGEF